MVPPRELDAGLDLPAVGGEGWAANSTRRMEDDGSTSLDVEPTGDGENGGRDSCVDEGDSDVNRIVQAGCKGAMGLAVDLRRQRELEAQQDDPGY